MNQEHSMSLQGKGGEAGTEGVRRMPSWFPAFAQELAELYYTGTTSTFVLHGNTFDDVRLDETPEYGDLGEFLAAQVFGRWDLVLHYDLSRGVRCLAGRNGPRLREMVALAGQHVGELTKMPRDPTNALLVLDRFLQNNVMAEADKRLSVAIIISHAGYVVPSGPRASERDARHLVTLLNWAVSPYLKRMNAAVVLVESELSHVSERLVGNPHVAAIEVPLPDERERRSFVHHTVGEQDLASVSDYGVEEIAQLTAGISLTDVNVMLKGAFEARQRLDRERFQQLKKRLIERQAQGLLEFVEPHWGLDTVVGHHAAKRRLADDAELIKRGQLQTVPMGYLICGPVGTGKSFFAMCSAGSMGIPLVKLKNFRSKYVGETEANLERILILLRSMGPVVVVVDEADAMLGDRDQGGDSGVGSRVFGMFAQQMGDTRYRGRILWMLLTARPDLLPIDIKRQGRAEIHIPIFYPTGVEEVSEMFRVLARKVGAELAEDADPNIPYLGMLSGADIEGIINRAWRTTLLRGERVISQDVLQSAVDGFIPSHQGLERELQELVAMIECTDAEFLPDTKQQRLEELGGREAVQRRINAIGRMLEET